VDIDAVLNRLMEAGVSVWLDCEGKLLIDKDAPEALKNLARQHKQELIDVQKALALVKSAGLRIIRLPLGGRALIHSPGADLDEIRWVMRVLRMDPMPLVINDEGPGWMTWNEWKLRRRVWNGSEQERNVRQPEPQERPTLQFGRKPS